MTGSSTKAAMRATAEAADSSVREGMIITSNKRGRRDLRNSTEMTGEGSKVAASTGSQIESRTRRRSLLECSSHSRASRLRPMKAPDLRSPTRERSLQRVRIRKSHIEL